MITLHEIEFSDTASTTTSGISVSTPTTTTTNAYSPLPPTTPSSTANDSHTLAPSTITQSFHSLTPSTPSSVSAAGYTFPHLHRHSALSPGHTYLIRSTTYDSFLTVSTNAHSQLTLSRDHGAAFDRWECVGKNGDGYLGLRNVRTAAYLGHNLRGKVVCEAGWHEGWESVVAEAVISDEADREEGERVFVLQMPHWWMLCPVGVVKGEGDGPGAFGLEWLDKGAQGHVWEFLRID